MNKLILIAALLVAGCSNKGDPEICRPSKWSGKLLVGEQQSLPVSEDTYRQCLIHYTYLLARDGGSDSNVTAAVLDRCTMAAGRYSHLLRQTSHNGSNPMTWTPEQHYVANQLVEGELARVQAEIPNFIVEAKAGDCRP